MNSPQDPITSKLRETAPDYPIAGGHSAERPQSHPVTGVAISNFQSPQLPQSSEQTVDTIRMGIQKIATGQTIPVTIESVISNQSQDSQAGTISSLEQPDGDHSTSIAIAIFNKRKLAKAA